MIGRHISRICKLHKKIYLSLNCFTIEWAEINMENCCKTYDRLSDFFLFRSVKTWLNSCTAALISLVAAIANINAPTARDNTHAITHSSYAIIIYCNVMANKNPIGFFESNGILQIMTKWKIKLSSAQGECV